MRWIKYTYRALFAVALSFVSILAFLSGTGKGVDGTWIDTPWILYPCAVVVAIAAIDQYQATWRVGLERQREEDELVELHLKVAFIDLFQGGVLTGPFHDVALQVWCVPRWYRRLFPYRARRLLHDRFPGLRSFALRPKLRRVARFRVRTGTSSGVAWRKGKGVVGLSLASSGDQRGSYCDLRSLHDRVGDLDEAGFNELPATERIGIRYSDFRRLFGKYGQILAVRIDSEAGDPIACITLNVPPDFPDMIMSRKIKDVLSTAIVAARPSIR